MPNRDSYRPRGLFIAVGIAVLVAAIAVAITWTLSVSAQADSWAISKSANMSSAHVGDTVLYTVTFTNTGTIAQTGIMTDVIPFGVTNVTNVTGGGTYISTSPARVNWSGSLAPGASHTVSFQVTVAEPGTLGPLPILNEARIDNTWSNAVVVYCANAESWAISKSANATDVYVGDIVLYTVTFTNTGTVTQTGIMTDVIPFGVTNVTNVTGGGTYISTSPARINWSGSLAPGASQTVSFQVTVAEPGTSGPLPILNEARIDNTWSNAVTIYSVPVIYDLAITKSASATDVNPGDIVTYTLNFTNTGTVDQSVIMTDVIPFGVTYVGPVTGGGVYNDTPGPARINWTGTLLAGASQTVTFAVLVVEPGTLGPYPILNEARLNNVWSNAVIIYSRGTGGMIYLPIVMRNYDPSLVWPWSVP